ncbi:MAG TPA: DUF2889 domain-containing protein [Acidimicrobiales bacterium]|nr:DUF2889 domain-containing protein [Acidimicrobiales bacterium]
MAEPVDADPRNPESPGPTVPEDEVPTHRRTIEVEVFEDGDDLVVVGRLQDARPWVPAGSGWPVQVHDMELAVTVRRSDLVITDARARMDRFPHAECVAIEPAFRGLVGLSVARGYSRAVQERFGRTLGCTHLELLARTIGPVVVQAIPSSAFRRGEALHDDPPEGAAIPQGRSGTAAARTVPIQPWLAGSCHIWAADGPGPDKLALGWRPGRGQYPAPSAVELRRSAAARDAGLPADDATSGDRAGEQSGNQAG